MLVYQRVISVTEINGSIQFSDKRLKFYSSCYSCSMFTKDWRESPTCIQCGPPHVFVFASTNYWQNCLMFIFSWVNRGSTWFNEHYLTIITQTHLVGGFNHLEKYESQWEGLSHIWNGKYQPWLKPPTSHDYADAVKKLRHPSVADTRPFDPRSHVAQLHAPESPVLEVIPSPVLEHGNRVSSQDKKQLFFWAFLDFLKIPNGKHIIPNYHPNTQLISLEISSTHGIPPTAPRMSCALMIWEPSFSTEA